ncbi:MAG: hypothetical protein KGK01_04055 [Bradyrhizobium sp.]|uniref:hypothetical protein n=1 Tax=Bradyrhizobium sp. TaxID=376 RepID=UPI001C29BB17|nr:hypothetical protein [Bradyrhizobium sp.]MBU6464407.1 hypothetical protein [Pseudomonadota bacterium]MDE2067478.1 hypothetical protein [Bradyrhizobium sp.]MDE2241634.1 hypothetical protein [Bradyrhizobium sp.]MDE2469493.1 hypothetical protein [Bradyrhizobium sp.]
MSDPVSDSALEAPVSDTDALEALLIAKVREKGGQVGNVTLQRELGWNDERYWPIRDRLVDGGHLELGRGKGGSVRLVPQTTLQESVDAAPAPEPEITESALYQPVNDVLDKEWARDMRFQNHRVEITARAGRRDTGGTWTRPDLVVAALRVFPHVPGKFFDLITFELKALNGINVTAVFEALAHRRAATQAYVWLHVPKDAADNEDVVAVLERIEDEAKRHGVGLIVAETPENYETWDTRLRATRFDPDPEFLNEFIAQQLSGLARDELAKWFR